MSGSTRHNLENEIIDRLYPGPRNVTDFVEEISYLRKVSVQGVYKALRALRKEEIITVHNHTASLSMVWAQKEEEKLRFAQDAYRSSAYLDEIRTGKKKRAQFTFHTLNEIDLFWTHSYLLLAEGVGDDTLSYNVQPHDWYPYVRFDTDAYWIRKHIENARVSRTILTHAGALDRAVVHLRKEQLGKLFEYTLNENPLKQDSHTYYNVLDSLIFTARFEPHIAEKLDVFVQSHTKLPLAPLEQKEINGIVSANGRFVLFIENNEEKAKHIRNKVKKFFEF